MRKTFCEKIRKSRACHWKKYEYEILMSLWHTKHAHQPDLVEFVAPIHSSTINLTTPKKQKTLILLTSCHLLRNERPWTPPIRYFRNGLWCVQHCKCIQCCMHRRSTKDVNVWLTTKLMRSLSKFGSNQQMWSQTDNHRAVLHALVDIW